jgi:transcriptional/translational regulatory protein YebC/TACO1
MDAALDAGAEDVLSHDDGSVEVQASFESFLNVKDALVTAGLQPAHAEMTMAADISVPLDLAGAEKLLAMIDGLEDLDDVQNVYTNAEIPDDVMEQLG